MAKTSVCKMKEKTAFSFPRDVLIRPGSSMFTAKRGFVTRDLAKDLEDALTLYKSISNTLAKVTHGGNGWYNRAFEFVSKWHKISSGATYNNGKLYARDTYISEIREEVNDAKEQ